ncbi:MAG TPA: alpha/beta hydrolase [Methanomassiliicoccales archaeon]|nr:alpha/beta hydrolase [Methanomassiliicoccales archaeon]
MKKAGNLMQLSDGSTLGKGGNFAGINGANIYYEEHGEGEPLILLHGAWSSVESFLNQAGEFCAHYRIIIPERRGHGRSADTPGPYSYAQGAEDMLSLIHELGIERAHLLGWSAGAIIGLMMAMKNPGLFSSFIPISGTFHRNGYHERFLRWFESSTPKSLGKVMVEIYRRNSPDGADHFPEFFEKIKAQAATHPDYTKEDLRRLRVPTLIIAADRDIIKLDHFVDYFNNVPEGELSIVPGTTHMLPVEKPELLNMQVHEFIQGNPIH